jgi:hypothetical protein
MTESEMWRAVLDLDVLRRLVRGLGCQCPDTIFDDVVVGRPTVFAETDAGSMVQLLVGRRLLVSFVELDHLRDARAEAERLLVQGARVRDAHGLNRFRLVLVGPCGPDALEALSVRAAAIDDRVHVHAITPEELARLLTPT